MHFILHTDFKTADSLLSTFFYSKHISYQNLQTSFRNISHTFSPHRVTAKFISTIYQSTKAGVGKNSLKFETVKFNVHQIYYSSPLQSYNNSHCAVSGFQIKENSVKFMKFTKFSGVYHCMECSFYIVLDLFHSRLHIGESNEF